MPKHCHGIFSTTFLSEESYPQAPDGTGRRCEQESIVASSSLTRQDEVSWKRHAAKFIGVTGQGGITTLVCAHNAGGQVSWSFLLL